MVEVADHEVRSAQIVAWPAAEDDCLVGNHAEVGVGDGVAPTIVETQADGALDRLADQCTEFDLLHGGTILEPPKLVKPAATYFNTPHAFIVAMSTSRFLALIRTRGSR